MIRKSCLPKAAVFSLGYNLCGNQQSKVGASDATLSIYDKKNRLIGVDFPGDTLVNSFAYNALDQRVKMVDSKGVTSYIYDGAGILMETNQSGQIMGAYTNGLMGAISKRNAANQYGYLMTDALGTVRNIVDANKDIKMSYKYDIFGAIREAVGTDPIGIPQTFTGKELDTDSGLHYFGARYYDSALGRFITADSWTWGPDDERVVFLGHNVFEVLGTEVACTTILNPYVYCLNNPLGVVDPSGHGLFYLIMLLVLIATFLTLMAKYWAKIRKLRKEDVLTWFEAWANSIHPVSPAPLASKNLPWTFGQVLNKGTIVLIEAAPGLEDIGDTNPVYEPNWPVPIWEDTIPRDISHCPPGSE